MTGMEHILSHSSIRLRIEVLKNEMSKSQRELEDLEAAERMVLRFGSANDAQVSNVANLFTLETSVKLPKADSAQLLPSPRKAMNLTGLVQAVMRQSASPWLTSEEVRAKASDLKGDEIPSGSIAPTLWKMKNDGEIVRDGYKVALASRLKENGGPLSPPDADDASTSSNQ